MQARFAGHGTFFSEGLAPVSSSDGKSGGYINKRGEFVIEGKFG
jgi:hypothetical protein